MNIRLFPLQARLIPHTLQHFNQLYADKNVFRRLAVQHLSCKSHVAGMSTSAGLASSVQPQKSNPLRRFAPLDPDRPNSHNAPKLKGIIFDVDGTLCLPQNYMFAEMREALSIPRTVDILTHIQSLSNVLADPLDPMSSPQAQASLAIRTIESRAMTSQEPQPGLVELFEYLINKRALPCALCTRNFPGPVEHLLNTFLPRHQAMITPVITRETKDVRPKPSPEGLWSIAESWKLHMEVELADVLKLDRKALGKGLIMVGDSVDDMEAGFRAGAATVLLLNEYNAYLVEEKPELVDLGIQRLDDLIDVLERGFEGRSNGRHGGA